MGEIISINDDVKSPTDEAFNTLHRPLIVVYKDNVGTFIGAC
jgi:hypothetical protein